MQSFWHLFHPPRFRHETRTLSWRSPPPGATLRFCAPGPGWAEAVSPGSDVSPGQALFTGADGAVVVAPRSGRVTLRSVVQTAADQREIPALVVALDDPASAGEAGQVLDREATAAQLCERFRSFGIALPEGSGPLVLEGLDPDVGGVADLQLVREQPEQFFSGATLLGKACGADRVVLTLPADEVPAMQAAAAGHGVELLACSDRYPQATRPLLQARIGGTARFVRATTALDALTASRGQVPALVSLTVLDLGSGTSVNVRVTAGVSIQELLVALAVTVEPGDKVVRDGALAGHALPDLSLPVDASLRALLRIPRQQVRPWQGEPCVACGDCVRSCPVRLQPHLLGRYGEYSLFEHARTAHVELCIGCGLCAAVCPSHRPLVQWIGLARTPLPAARTPAAAEPERAEEAK